MNLVPLQHRPGGGHHFLHLTPLRGPLHFTRLDILTLPHWFVIALDFVHACMSLAQVASRIVVFFLSFR
jgi:hypothetical protein